MHDLTWIDGLVIAGLFVIALVAGRIVGHTISAIICRIGGRGTEHRHEVLRRACQQFRGPASTVMGIAAWEIALVFVELPEDARFTLHELGRTGLVIALVWSALRFVDFLVWVATKRTNVLDHHQVSRSLLPLGRRVVKIAIVAVAFVAVLGSLGYSITGLVAGLGVTGIAVAFAAQKTLENVFGAFALGIDRPLREGDTVKVDGVLGTVEQIGLRSTRVRTQDRTLVSFPNGKLADSMIESRSARDRTRLDAKFRLLPGAPSKRYREVLSSIAAYLEKHPKKAADAPQVHLTGPGDTWLELEVVAQFQTANWNEFQAIRDEALLACLDAFEAAGVTISGAVTPKQEPWPEASSAAPTSSPTNGQRARDTMH